MTTRDNAADAEVASLWNKAAQLIEAGRPADAEAQLRRGAKRRSGHPDLVHLLAVAMMRQSRPGEAEPLLRSVLASQPREPGVLMNLGQALLDLGRPAEAVGFLDRASEISPSLWQASYLLGVAAERSGDRSRAAAAYANVVSADRSIWDAHLRLVTVLRLDGRLDDAARAAKAALAVRPDDTAIRHDLAMLLALGGHPSEALDVVDETLRRAPDFPEAFSTRGNILGDLGRPAEATACYRKALGIRPDFADAHYNLANLERGTEDYASSCRRYRRTLALTPSHLDARNNLAAALLGWGRVDDAIAAYDECLARSPGWHDALFNRGMALMLKGDMRAGLDGYESRWRVSRFPGVRRDFRQPSWDGAAFAGRRLLLHAEQGAGDTIQFARYVPLVCARGGEVIVECPSSLVRLLSTVDGRARVVRSGEPLPPFDLQLPFGSLMRAFGTEIETIPAKVPYLAADPSDRERWRRRLAGPGFKVGITWQGNPDQGSEPHRSIPLALLRPVLELSGCRFYALQKEFGRDQLREIPEGLIEDVGPELSDFAETAALVSELDLVISTCTSVAHLSGALGKPTWVLLRAVPDWRWLLGRADSPWYPSVDLFRQEYSGDWGGVVGGVLGRLGGIVGVR